MIALDPVLLRLLAVVVLLLVTVAVGRGWRARDGEVRSVEPSAARLDEGSLDALGLDLRGARAGAVLLGAASCAPCTQVEAVLADLAAERDGFRWVYADAAEHLELADRHAVRRVPTLFVLAPGGEILARTSGVPRAEDLRQVLDGEVSAA